MMRLYLSSLSPWNSTYSNEEGHLLFKADSPASSNPRQIHFSRALPDVTLPTSERQLWEERHFFETHPSSRREHPELDGQGSGFYQDGTIMEENREDFSIIESNDSLYEFPLRDPAYPPTKRSGSPSPSRSSHSDAHPFWTKEHWVHFADAEYHWNNKTHFNVAGKEFNASEFFKSSGHTREFTAWNGLQYRWYLKSRHLKLFLCHANDQESELVAEYDHSTVVFNSTIGKRKVVPPCLTIYELGEPILDLIIVTLVYLELCAKDGMTTSAHTGQDLRFSGPKGAPALSNPPSPVAVATGTAHINAITLR